MFDNIREIIYKAMKEQGKGCFSTTMGTTYKIRKHAGVVYDPVQILNTSLNWHYTVVDSDENKKNVAKLIKQYKIPEKHREHFIEFLTKVQDLHDKIFCPFGGGSKSMDEFLFELNEI